MATKELTDREIQTAKLEPGQSELTLTASKGLYLRVRAGGLKSWFYWYTSPIGKGRRKLFFGTYPATTLAEARKKTLEYRTQVQSGIDPKHEEEQAELTAVLNADTPKTLNDLFTAWKKLELVSHKDKGEYAGGFLERLVLPKMGNVELERLRQPQIATVLAEVKATGKLATTGKVLGYLRQMFSYAVERGWMAGDPTAGMSKVKWAGPRSKRKRVLSRAEITRLSELCVTAELPPMIECSIWILLACSTRVGETGLAQLKHLDFEKMCWFIPKENQKKTKSPPRDHWVELSPFAMKWFKRLIELQHERAIYRNNLLPKDQRLAEVPEVKVDWLLPAQKRPGAINHKTISHSLHDRQRPGQEPVQGRTQLVDVLVLDGGKWTPHDLRRTSSTLMRELKTPQDVIERCLNHVADDDMVATYQLAELREEMQTSWNKLSEILEVLVTRQPSDVRYSGETDELDDESITAQNSIENEYDDEETI